MIHSNNNTNKTVGEASFRRGWCDTSEMPLQQLLWNDDGTYFLVDDGEFSNSGNITGGIRSRSRSLADYFVDENSFDVIYPVHVADRRQLFQALNNSERFVYGRECTCARETVPVYCPIEANICRTRQRGVFLFSDGSPTLQCEAATSTAESLLMCFLLPTIMCMYLFLLCFIVGTAKGKNAVTFTIRLLCCWEEDQYQGVLVREVDDRARASFRRRVRLARITQSTEIQRKVAASIRTRPFDKTLGLPEECMICLAEFEVGDRVGDLSCGHMFHIDPCLKQWVERKNHCPLCHAENLAVPTDKSPKRKSENVPNQNGETDASSPPATSSDEEDNARDTPNGERLPEDANSMDF